jgi:hypothetical protein
VPDNTWQLADLVGAKIQNPQGWQPGDAADPELGESVVGELER